MEKGLENFPERLKRNSRFIPVTSTPKPAKDSRVITKKDVDTCFGFDDSDEENYDTMISPIAAVAGKVKRMKNDNVRMTRSSARINKDGAANNSNNALLARNPEPDDGLKLHFDNARAMKTYTPKKDRDVPVSQPKSKTSRGGRQKSTRKDKKVEVDDVDTEMTNYDAMISSVAVAEKVQEDEDVPMLTYARGNDGGDSFNALLARYRKPEPDDGLKLHFDNAGPMKTYTHKKDRGVHLEGFVHQKPKTSTGGRQKSTRKTKKVEDSDAEMEKWLEAKNKEFEDLLHVPLVVRKSK